MPRQAVVPLFGRPIIDPNAFEVLRHSVYKLAALRNTPQSTARTASVPALAALRQAPGLEVLDAYVARGYFVGLTGFAGMERRGAHVRELLAAGRLPLSPRPPRPRRGECTGGREKRVGQTTDAIRTVPHKSKL